MFVTTRDVVVFAVLSSLLTACGPVPEAPGPDPLTKIAFDLDQLDENGLVGPADGKRALAYEFCIPPSEECKELVSSLDPTVEIMCGSPGRIGCYPDECLCVGSTHQENFRDVLRKIAELPYVEKIDETVFE
jgi:hypothetical protein